MNNQEAKLILCACRSDGQEQHEPSVREALDCAESDPVLAAWLAREQTLDAALCAKLSEIPVPASLKSEILAGARVIKPTFVWTDARTLLGAAAAVALAAVMVWSKDAPAGAGSLPVFAQASPSGVSSAVASLASFRNDMAGSFAQMQSVGFTPDLRTSNVDAVEDFLTQRVSRTIEVGEIVDNLGDARLFGCRMAEWRGQKVSMLCLNSGTEEAHLFVVHQSALTDVEDVKPKMIENCSGYPAAAWRDGDKAYVLVGHRPETDLTKFF
ncbi:MAG: hypothetical protein JNJ83_02670 [Verrucomicrobiaceae bacterium]|nr:hypothetical protein [Verrucomicrobiaceae bacterium]